MMLRDFIGRNSGCVGVELCMVFHLLAACKEIISYVGSSQISIHATEISLSACKWAR
jgi:hypothetical protein